MTFFVPGQIRNLTNTRGHWSERHRYSADWRGLVKAHALRALAAQGTGSPDSPKRITLTATVRRRLDQDGLRAALKPVLDALQVEREIRQHGVLVGWHVGAGIIRHDGPGCGHIFEYQQVLSAGKTLGVTIQIEPLDDPAG